MIGRKLSREERKPSNLRRLLAYVKPHWPQYALATAAGLVKFLMPVAIAWLVGQAVDTLGSVNAGKMSNQAGWIEIKRLLLIGAGIVLASPIFVYWRSAVSARATQEVIKSLRCDLYAHIQKLSHSFFDSNRSGSLTSRIIGDTEMIQPFLGKAFVQIWLCIALISVVLTYFFSKSVYLGLLSVSLLPVQLLIQRKIGWRVKRNATAIRDHLARLSGSAQEKLAAATVVKAFTGEDEEIQRFSDDSNVLVGLGVKNSKLSGMSEASMNFVRYSTQLVVVLIGGHLALFHPGEITVGLLIQFILMQGQIYTPFEWLNEMQLITASALGATDRIFSIFDTEPEVADRPGAVRAPRFRGEIVLERVCFSYPTSDNLIFDRLDLVIPAKTTLALVGPSGGGKTTVTHLLNRFYELDSGRILIDGRDTCDYTIYSLRHQIGLVPQEPVLFSGTIAENILYGRPDASFEEVCDAARRAYAEEFIEEMEDGYETMLGERGVRLSGGQRQRISIARTFLKDPAIIVLDEATSALDSESERIVQQALEELTVERTTIVVAHRLSTIKNADQIAVVDQGRVIELGPHDALIAQGGLYARLCEQQFDLSTQQ